MKENYDVYNEKHLGVIHIANRYGVREFKFPKVQGVPSSMEPATHMLVKKSLKLSLTSSSHTFLIISFISLEAQVGRIVSLHEVAPRQDDFDA